MLFIRLHGELIMSAASKDFFLLRSITYQRHGGQRVKLAATCREKLFNDPRTNPELLMSTTSIDEGSSVTRVSEHQYQELREEDLPEFSPFSSLPGLVPPETKHFVPASEKQASCSTKGDEVPAESESTLATVHVTREVFTIRAGQEEESVYLNEQLRQLEVCQGLVTLSTETSKDQGKESQVQPTVSGEQIDRSNGPSVNEPDTIGLSTTQKDADLSREHKDQTANDKVEANTCISDVNGNVSLTHNLNPESDSRNTLDKGKNTLEKTAHENNVQLGNPLGGTEINSSPQADPLSGVPNGHQAVTSKIDDSVIIDSFRDSALTSDSSTQTEAITLSPTVDFYLWEQRRLACNGWGVHRHDGDDISQLGLVHACLVEGTDRQLTGDRAERSPLERNLTLDSNIQRSSNLIASGPTKTNRIANTSTQTRSPSIKPSCLRIKNLLQSNNTSPIRQTRQACPVYERQEVKLGSQRIHPLPSCVKDAAHPCDAPSSVSGHSTPWGSVSTTPRAHDKTPDALNSSRSASVLSDSGTSSSIPSAIINSAKPFTNRTQQKKPTSEMAAVSSNPSSTQTTPPVSGRDHPKSPISSPQAPTLKVEYVTKVWDAYISDFLLASDHIKHAAIFDRATATCIATSFDFLITAEEFQQLQRSLSSLTEATLRGVTLQGKHYKTFLADGRRGLMAKGAERSGCSACQTRTLVLIAVHDYTGKPARCNEEVMRLGDFFWAKGL